MSMIKREVTAGVARLKLWNLKVFFRFVFFVLLILAGTLLYSQIKDTDWEMVGRFMQEISVFAFVLTLALVMMNYLAFIGYDLLARRYTSHALSVNTTMAISFVCYAFNFNLGAAIGSAGLKFKLYAERGISPAVVGRIISFCIVTHWLGFCLLAGTVFLLWGMDFSAVLLRQEWWLRPLSAVFIFVPALYIVLCFCMQKYTFSFFSHAIVFPASSTALLQVILASVNWVMTSAVLYVIFQCKIDPFHMAQVFLVSSIAASMVHIPAGMGVIESVFLFFFAGALPKEEIVASLLMYRFFFYLLPLVVAIAFYILMEIRHR